jgi:hypothetical protein
MAVHGRPGRVPPPMSLHWDASHDLALVATPNPVCWARWRYADRSQRSSHRAPHVGSGSNGQTNAIRVRPSACDGLTADRWEFLRARCERSGSTPG